jgi:hypothetical protein
VYQTTRFDIPFALELLIRVIWRTYRGCSDCENRIKELKSDFGLDAFIRDYWATEYAPGFAMPAMPLFFRSRSLVFLLLEKLQHLPIGFAIFCIHVHVIP